MEIYFDFFFGRGLGKLYVLAQRVIFFFKIMYLIYNAQESRAMQSVIPVFFSRRGMGGGRLWGRNLFFLKNKVKYRSMPRSRCSIGTKTVG